MLQDFRALRVIAGIGALSALVLGLAGCETTPPPRPAPPPAGWGSGPYGYGPPPPNTTVYAYPERGQSADQQSRDRYECSLWAVHQTGFDPSAPNVPAYDKVVVSGPPPGTGTAIGAIAGAVLGAAIAGPYDRGAGAVFGGLTGAMIGNASDVSREQENQEMLSEQDRQQAASMAQKASEYRRAISACLEGRGYSVK
ncbi:MAG TPA: glycine zipper 2TM domain-containing protein [Steroidobacteraceae bacterium]|nr:glycine zipper 2TM domain-containing protein [Steroidobacteraceae bacterium]